MYSFDSLSAPSKIFIYTSIRIPPLRLCFVGFLFGTNESPDNPINAGARLSMAKYSCFIDYDVLCPIGIHHAKRNTGIMPPEKESENNVSGNDAIQDNRIEQLTLVSRLLLYPATFFLGAGIFLGAVWANVSWGRYWAWDPKEVWALITFLVYGVAFHSQSLRIFRKPLFFHIYMILAFLTVLMTYFGVNYVLGGMHSYANA